jgi:hypothetical protein
VRFLAVQTVFEGYRHNTPEKLRENQLKYDLKIPMAHAVGNQQTNDVPGVMARYRTGGTPWSVIIGPSGVVVFNGFHIHVADAIALINQLVAKQN